MKAKVLHDARGRAVASILEAPQGETAVPLDAELEEGEIAELKEVEFRTRELFDLDALHKRFGR